MNYNRAVVIGNITRDPELKSLPSGSNVTSFSVASNRTWNDKQSGEQKKETEFHNIVVFGKMAETVAKYMRKGSQILVEGRLKTRIWEKDGNKNYRTEIVAENVQFGTRPKGSENAAVEQDGSAPAPEDPSVEEEIKVEDIPF